MANKKFDSFERRAFWEAHNKKCAYCSCALAFKELEIEHIIPESLVKESEENLSNVFSRYSLPSNFELNSYDNLVPSCRSCNGLKSSNLLEPGFVAIMRAVAIKIQPRVEQMVIKFRKEDTQEKARFFLACSIESGKLTRKELLEIMTLTLNNKGVFKVTSPFPFMGDNSIRELSKDQYETYLDDRTVLPSVYEDGFLLTNENQDERLVFTIREYKNAITLGYSPNCNASDKAAAAIFERPFCLLNYLLKAKFSERSFIDSPYRGVADIGLLPSSLLFSFEDIVSEDMKNSQLQMSSLTIGELVKDGKATIVEISSDSVTIHTEEYHTTLFELMRADFTGDGNQDMLICWSGGPLRGTMWFTRIFLLKKESETDNFLIVSE